MKGWVGLVGWPVADGLPTLVVTHQLQVERRTGKVRQSETDVLLLCYATKAYSNTDKTSVWYIWSLVSRVRRLSLHICLETSWLHSWCQYGVWGLDDIDHPMIVNAHKQNDSWFVFSTSMLLVGRQEGIRPVKNWMVGCWHGYLSEARYRLAYGPADATATHCLLLQHNPDWFYLSGTGSPGQSWKKGR